MTEFDCKEKVSELVPHKGKMLLIDRVTAFDFSKGFAETEVDVTKDSTFYDSTLGGVPVWTGFEYMAQSISALIGIEDRLSHKSPTMGVILSVPHFKAEKQFFAADTTVRISVQRTMQIDVTTTFEGSVFCGDEKMATATILAMEVDDPAKILGD